MIILLDEKIKSKIKRRLNLKKYTLYNCENEKSYIEVLNQAFRGLRTEFKINWVYESVKVRRMFEMVIGFDSAYYYFEEKKTEIFLKADCHKNIHRIKWEKFIDYILLIFEHEYIHKIQDQRILKSGTDTLKLIDCDKLEGENRWDYYNDGFERIPFACDTINQFMILGYSKDKILNILSNTEYKYKRYTFFDSILLYRKKGKISRKIYNKYLKYCYFYLNTKFK